MTYRDPNTGSHGEESPSCEKTETIEGIESVKYALLNFTDNAKRIDRCGGAIWPSVLMGLDDLKNAFENFSKRGGKARCITDITFDNTDYCIHLTQLCELRHLSGMKGSFAINDRGEYIAAATLQRQKPAEHLIYSNSRIIVEQQQYMFELLWDKAIPAEQRIREIKEGIMPETTEIINVPLKIQNLCIKLIESASKEILALFPNTSSFHLENKIGVMGILKDVASKNKNIHVRILTPIDSEVQKILDILKSEKNIDIRPIEPSIDTIVKILVVDRQHSLIAELKDDSTKEFADAVGTAVYSTSKQVMSYVSIFQSFWQETEMFEQLRIAKEKIEDHDRMQRDFINIAAHELRTPTQAIIGYTELIVTDPEYKQYIDEIGPFIDSIKRNAERLGKLTEDILNVARIESNRLVLHKENFNLNEKIQNVMNDFNRRLSMDERKKGIQLIFSKTTDPLIVNADRVKIFEVLSNLISNSIKFLEDSGKITISVDMKNRNGKGIEATSPRANKQLQLQQQIIIVHVKDDGKGIHPDVMPNLFKKFITKSQTGTGLGLFISKSIIEAHGGRIWAENNKDGKGATFSFTLPVH